MEAATTYAPDFSSEGVFDEYLASLTEDELSNFIESINEGRRAFERGEYYEFEEVFAELEERFGAYE